MFSLCPDNVPDMCRKKVHMGLDLYHLNRTGYMVNILCEPVMILEDLMRSKNSLCYFFFIWTIYQ